MQVRTGLLGDLMTEFSGPLRIDHLEQIDLRRGALDIWQRVDSAKAIERAPDNDFD